MGYESVFFGVGVIMASPFGLAYGIGAGLANAPKAFYQGKADALATGLKELEASEYRRKVEEQRSLEQALSQAPEAPPATTVTTPGITQEQYDEMASHDVPEGEEGPNQTYGQEIAKTRTVTPFQSPAGERASMLKKAAEMQRSRGFGLSASQLMQQAQTADKEHQAASALELIRASKFGNSDKMMSAVYALGGKDIRDVRSNGSEGVIVTSGDGHEIELDSSDLQEIMTGKNPYDVFQKKAKQMQENKLEQMNLQAAQREQENATRFQHQKELLESRLNSSEKIAQMRAQYQRETGQNASTAKMRDIQNFARIYMADQAKMGIPVTAEDAEAWAMNRVIGTDRGRVTEADTFRAAVADRRALLRDNPNASKPGNKDYATWKSLSDQIASLTRPGSTPRTASPEPSMGGKKFSVTTDGTGKVVKSNDPRYPIGAMPRMGGKLVLGQTINY